MPRFLFGMIRVRKDEQIMKRFIWILLILLLAGCVKRPEEEVTIVPEDKGEQLMELDKLDVSLNRSFKNLYVKWNKIDEPGLIYRVTVQDGEGKDLAFAHTDYESYNAADLIAYAAQENEYYGPMSFLVEAMRRGSEEVLLSGQSESFQAGEFFPEEKEISIADKTITSFSYSARKSTMVYGMYIGELQDVNISVKDKEISCYGSYVKNGKLKEFEKKLKKEDWEEIEAFLKQGKLVRKRVNDPDLLILDADFPERKALRCEGMDRLQENWYELEVPDREGLLKLLLEKVR